MHAIIVSEPMRTLVALAERVARSTATVLITGESGTGKEIIARAVHHYSLRVAKAVGRFEAAPRSPNIFLKASSSATTKAPSAAPIRPSRGCSSWRIKAPFS